MTHVPETLSLAKALVSVPKEELTWTDQGKGYSTVCTFSEYGGIKQRWLLVFSKQAYEREKKKLAAQEETLTKALWHLGNEIFNCEEDAQKSLKVIAKNILCIRLKVRF